MAAMIAAVDVAPREALWEFPVHWNRFHTALAELVITICYHIIDMIEVHETLGVQIFPSSCVLVCASAPSARAGAVHCHHSAKGDLVMTDTAARRGIASPKLQVIGTGFGRTGTASLRDALVRLGFGPCDHMRENFEHPKRFPLWAEALRRKDAGEPIDWRPLLADFQAIVDWPGAYFWRELTATHPAAKVILTVRDPERWYNSIQATIFSLRDDQLPAEPPPAPSTTVSPTGRIAWPFSLNTIRPCKRRSPRSGCWSLTSSKGGSRCARSWASPFPRMSRFRASMTPPRSRTRG